MNADVLARLAIPATDADRRRARLVASGVAGVTTFLLAAVAIATAGLTAVHEIVETYSDGSLVVTTENRELLAPFLAERGLRAGTTFGVLLLIVPFLTFAVMAMRTGTAARERRLAALSLAGATRSQLRAVAAREGMRAAVLGVLLGAPVYLVTWLLAGAAMPDGWKLLPTPAPLLAGAYALIAVGLIGVAALAAVLASDVARIGPLGVTRRIRRPLGVRDAVQPLVCVGFLALAYSSLLPVGPRVDLVYVVFLAVLALALSGGRWLAQAAGWLSLRTGMVGALAGRRMLGDVRTPGRVAGVLLAAGLAIGGVGAFVPGVLTTENPYDDSSLRFYLIGAGIAGAGAVLTAVVATATLVVGATEQVLDGRRGIAVLVALAASPKIAGRIVRRQLVLAAVPPIVLGSVVGGAVYSSPVHGSDPWWLISVPVAALVGFVGALLAARIVRPAVLSAASADSLRAA